MSEEKFMFNTGMSLTKISNKQLIEEIDAFEAIYPGTHNPLDEYITSNLGEVGNMIIPETNYSNVSTTTITSICRFTPSLVDSDNPEDNSIKRMIFTLFPIDLDSTEIDDIEPCDKRRYNLPDGFIYTKRYDGEVVGMSPKKVSKSWKHSVILDMIYGGNINFKISSDNIQSCGIKNEANIDEIYDIIIKKINGSIIDFNTIFLCRESVDNMIELMSEEDILFLSREDKDSWISKFNIVIPSVVNSVIRLSEHSGEFCSMLRDVVENVSSLGLSPLTTITPYKTSIEMMKNKFGLDNDVLDFNFSIKKFAMFLSDIQFVRYTTSYHPDISTSELRIKFFQNDHYDDEGNPINFFDRQHTITILTTGVVNHTGFGRENMVKVYNQLMSLIFEMKEKYDLLESEKPKDKLKEYEIPIESDEEEILFDEDSIDW